MSQSGTMTCAVDFCDISSKSLPSFRYEVIVAYFSAIYLFSDCRFEMITCSANYYCVEDA